MKIECPGCKNEFDAEMVTGPGDDNRFSMVIELEDDRFLMAKTLAGVILNTGKMMESAAKSQGAKVVTLVEKIEVNGNKVKIGFLIAKAIKDVSRTKGSGGL